MSCHGRKKYVEKSWDEEIKYPEAITVSVIQRTHWPEADQHDRDIIVL